MLGTVVAVLFAVLGAGAGFLAPVTWTAESRVAVGSGDLTSAAIAGFPLAASQLASNYARYVNDSGVAGNPVPVNVELSASQIPDSNVVRIEASSADPAAAQAAANDTAQKLIDLVNNNGNEPLDGVYEAFTAAADDDAAADSDLAAAQRALDNVLGKTDSSKAAIKAARSKVAEASAKAARTGMVSDALRQKYTSMVAGNTSSAKLQLARTADTIASNRTSLVTRFALLGLAAGAVLGLLIAIGLDRRLLARGSVHAGRRADDAPGE